MPIKKKNVLANDDDLKYIDAIIINVQLATSCWSPDQENVNHINNDKSAVTHNHIIGLL